MSETPAAPDLNAAMAVAQTENLIFIGKDATSTLHDFFIKKPGQSGITDVIMFPYQIVNGEAVAAGGPRRGTFTGTVLSATLNDRMTKGRFVFADGTILYRDSTIIE